MCKQASHFLIAAILTITLVGCSEEVPLAPPQLTLTEDSKVVLEEFFDANHCDDEGLLPLYEAATLAPEEAANWDLEIDGLSGDQIARVAFQYAETEVQSAEDFDRTLLYLLLKSAEKESALGLNEMGAAQMYCYQGVQKDIESAAQWLERAVAKGDATAMLSLGRVHAYGMLGERSSSAYGMKLLLQCSVVGNSECEREIEALSDAGLLAP